MKNILLTTALCAIVMPFANAGDGWETNMDAAKKKAAEENKGLLIEFTGSDWCPPCQSLKKNVLTKDEFLKAAQKDFVLVELDFPRSKEQSADLKKQNEQYAGEYSVTGFPTVVFTDAQGRPVNSFVGGRDLNAVLKEIQTAEANRKFVDETLAKLKDAKGDERYVLIGELFKKVPVDYMDKFYPDLAKEVKGDTENKSGLKSLLAEKQAEADFQTFMRSIPQDVTQDPQKIYDYIDNYMKKEGKEMEPALKQQMTAVQASILYSMDKVDDAVSKLGEAIDILPNSKISGDLKEAKEQIAKDKK